MTRFTGSSGHIWYSGVTPHDLVFQDGSMRLLPTLALLAGLAAPAALCQTPATPPTVPPCDGAFAIVRVSEIKPESSMDKFLAAVAAQKAWYAAHVPGDKIFVSRVKERKATEYSTTEAITYHFYSNPTGAEPKHDAGFDAFVKLYSESSTITATYFTCMPAGLAPSM